MDLDEAVIWAPTIAFSESEPAYDQITIVQLNDRLIHMGQLHTKADITTFICFCQVTDIIDEIVSSI